MGFKVQSKLCATCIYRKGFAWDIEHLEKQVREKRPLGSIAFKGFRQRHHSTSACCRGFWNLHKDEFTAGQIAQRLGLVEFVEHDTLDTGKRNG